MPETEPDVSSPPNKNSSSVSITRSDLDISIDFQSLEYLTQVDQHLLCPICQCVFVDPLSTQCGHTFCRACIEAVMAAQSLDCDFVNYTCPVDRSSFTMLPAPSFSLKGLLDALLVRCTHSARGCESVFPRWQIETHLRFDCQYVLEPCVADCHELAERRWKSSGRCPHTVMDCFSKCGASLPLSELETPYGAPGPHRRICMNSIQPSIQGADSPDCPGRDLGCSYKGSDREHAKLCSLAAIQAQLQNQRELLQELSERNRVLENYVLMTRHDLTTSAQAQKDYVEQNLSASNKQLALVNEALERSSTNQAHCSTRLTLLEERQAHMTLVTSHMASSLDEVRAALPILSQSFTRPTIRPGLQAHRFLDSYVARLNRMSMPPTHLAATQGFTAEQTGPTSEQFSSEPSIANLSLVDSQLTVAQMPVASQTLDTGPDCPDAATRAFELPLQGSRIHNQTSPQSSMEKDRPNGPEFIQSPQRDPPLRLNRL